MTQQLRQLALPIEEPLLRAIRDFDCLGGRHAADPVAENVNGFLVDGRFLPGLEQGVSSTYLLLDPEAVPPLLGYVTLTFDSVRLTNAERRQMQDLFGIGEFGALRIQMIGIDRRHQGEGFGTALLEAITGLARKLSSDVALRFLLRMPTSAKSSGTGPEGSFATRRSGSDGAPIRHAVSRCASISSKP